METAVARTTTVDAAAAAAIGPLALALSHAAFILRDFCCQSDAAPLATTPADALVLLSLLNVVFVLSSLSFLPALQQWPI